MSIGPSGKVLDKLLKTILDSLRQIAASNINLYYVNGNHDYDLAHCVVVEPGDNGKTAVSLLSMGPSG
jgi:UDP-2,3-diacylglucosamine pyrophosphatase LpxH